MAVSHLKILNPELSSECIGLRAKIVDGQLIPDSLEEEEEE